MCETTKGTKNEHKYRIIHSQVINNDKELGQVRAKECRFWSQDLLHHKNKYIRQSEN